MNITPSPYPPLVTRVLWKLIGADMNTTDDQAFTKVGSFNDWTAPNGAVQVIARTGPPTSAAGGIYSAAAKGGTVMMAASTNYSTMASVNTRMTVNLSTGNLVNLSALFLSLTTPHGSAATADFFIIGIPLN